MLINGYDIKRAGAKQLTVDIAPSNSEITYEWNSGARLPLLVDNRATFKTATITLKVAAENRQEAIKSASIIHGKAAGQAEYKLDNYPGWVFVGVLDGAPTLTKTIDKTVYRLQLKIKGYMRNEALQEEQLNRCYTGYVNIEGSRDAPVIIEVDPQIDLPQFTITGVAEREIIINRLTKGSKIYIDGYTGLVTENGQNKFNEVVLFEFPYLQPGENKVIFSESVCNVTIKYYPMWI